MGGWALAKASHSSRLEIGRFRLGKGSAGSKEVPRRCGVSLSELAALFEGVGHAVTDDEVPRVMEEANAGRHQPA